MIISGDFSVEFESELESQNDQFRALEPPESPEFCTLTLRPRNSTLGPEMLHGLFSLADTLADDNQSSSRPVRSISRFSEGFLGHCKLRVIILRI